VEGEGGEGEEGGGGGGGGGGGDLGQSVHTDVLLPVCRTVTG
jgi:hypothetical protein